MELAIQILKLITEVIALLLVLVPIFQKSSKRIIGYISKKFRAVTHILGYHLFEKLSRVGLLSTLLKKPYLFAGEPSHEVDFVFWMPKKSNGCSTPDGYENLVLVCGQCKSSGQL